MNIYLVSQSVNQHYDTFDSFVCYANSEEEAKSLHPSGTPLSEMGYTSDWVSNAEDVTVSLLGSNPDITESSIILSSFNAG
jgi:hypothetical protein